ncbi:hypothetical protein [Puia dinghuensis]|uniref:Tetratricopeptide repeat protein n=1 Tax=Puia dinghuensis TaxID=1792502 RepID=A0A8J2UAR1_9BACT|nr:hypothetical protein [Puia dinghuensis]GGA91073.1 hypothetical protein GCM10011511_12980 [Puia dinghuensis]
MTRTSLKKSWIILTSACTIAATIVLACADMGPEYGTSNFTPEIFVDSAYSPFFYSNQFYYGIGHDEAHITRWKYDNIGDWGAWLDKTLSYETLDYLLDTASEATLDSAKAWFLAKPEYRPACLSAARLTPKLIAFIHYLAYAKKCEAFALTPIIPAWEQDSTKPKPHFNATTLNRQLQESLNTTPDPFLQERYWFQLLRSQFFNGTPRETISLFDTYSPQFPHNKIWYRSLAYTAGAYYKQKQYSKANYYYSRVFESCAELRTVAHYSFHPQEEADWQGTLALCRNTEEKATLWQMLGIFYSDPQRAITRIYELDPHSEKLYLLLSRAINTSEQRGVWADETPGNHSAGENNSLLALVTRIATANNTSKPWVWQLAAGYLNMLARHYTTATGYFTKAETTVPHQRLPQAQFRLLNMLNTVYAAHTIDYALEQKLLPDIEWLESCQQDQSFRNDDAWESVKRTMAANYLLTGDKVKSECFSSRSAFYTDNHNVEALKAFLSKPDKTPYEQRCTHLSAIQREDIFEYQAVILCLNDHIDEALAAMQQVPSAKTTVLPGNPFNARIVDCHDCDHEATQKVKYTKLTFLQKLKELKDKIAANSDVYTNAILLGNAEYNITHFGNARVFYECKVLGSGHGMPEMIDSVFRAPLTSMSTAIKYYTLALNAAQTDEQRAKCQYLLSKCQRNTWYNNTIFKTRGYEYGDYKGPDFIAWDGFKALKQYPNSSYYKEVLKECGYFRTYIQKNK